MLKPIVKEQGVTHRERYLAKLANEKFFGLWSYPSVYRDEGKKNNKGVGQEVCDLLVVFDDVVIIFSDKDIEFKEGQDIKVAWGRWYRASVLASSKQLYGAESFIKNHPDRIFLNKECSERFPFNFSDKPLRIHLVAVTCNSYEPAKKYFARAAEGSTGSLVQMYGLSQEHILNYPFTINDLNPHKTFVHVLDEFTLDRLMEELGTISDFVDYLAKKETAIRSGRLVQALGEEDILATYLMNVGENGFGEVIPNEYKNRDALLKIPEGSWGYFKKTFVYGFHLARKKANLRWSELIENFSTAILSANVGEHQTQPLLSHEGAVRMLASENLSSREILSTAMVDKFDRTPSAARSARLVWSLSNSRRLYILLFVPRQQEAYEAYRSVRYGVMNLYVLVARYKYPEAIEVVVVATEPKGSVGRSESILAVDSSVPLSSDERRLAQKVMRDENILDSTINYRPGDVDFHLTASQPKGRSRNEPCTCGSGLKAKKCKHRSLSSSI